ncbi:MAG TPA: T9SS type A sorting domain-containing protein [Bacteroidales bacterium]
MKAILTIILALFVSIPSFAQVERKVVIEHFTNSRCSICAARNPAFYTTLEAYPDVLHIAYHPSSPYPTCIFNQHNPIENDGRTYFYGIYGGTPRVVIQGDVIPVQNPLISAEQIDSYIGETANYSVILTNEKLSGNNYKVVMQIKREAGTDWETIQAWVGLAEEEIDYAAPNGENLHHDVFRKWVFKDTASINPAGSSRTWEFEYQMDPAWVEGEMFAYVILQDLNTQKVLQSGSSLDTPSGINKPEIVQLSNVLYPNPSNGKVFIRTEMLDKFTQAEIFSLTGNKIGTYTDLGSIDISGLQDGMYLMVFTGADNQIYTSRLVKSAH